MLEWVIYIALYILSVTGGRYSSLDPTLIFPSMSTTFRAMSLFL